MPWKPEAVLFATVLLACPAAMSAQAGRGASAAPVAVPRSSVQNLGGRPYPVRTDLPAPTGLIAPAASYTGISPGALRSTGRSRVRYGGLGYGGLGYGYYGGLPYLDDAFSSGFPGYNDQAADETSRAQVQAQNAVARQLELMNRQIRQLQDDQAQGAYPPPPYAMSPQPAPSLPSSQPAPADSPAPPIVLVLQDGKHIALQSYAVMNGTIWDFTKQPTRKIALSTVDIAASERATAASGAEFPSLTSSR